VNSRVDLHKKKEKKERKKRKRKKNKVFIKNIYIHIYFFNKQLAGARKLKRRRGTAMLTWEFLSI
jgi:hypothetical protein